MPRCEGDDLIAGGVPGTGVENRDAASDDVVLRRRCLQPDVIPDRDRVAGKGEAGAVYGFKRGQQIGFIAKMGVKLFGIRIFAGAVTDGREESVETNVENALVIYADRRRGTGWRSGNLEGAGGGETERG